MQRFIVDNKSWYQLLDDLEAISEKLAEIVPILRTYPVISLASKPKTFEEQKNMSEVKKTSLTEADIEATIASEDVCKLGQKTTVVVLTLKNGFEVIGSSACVDPNNYNEEVGKTYARKRALDKVWELEGYKLQSAEE